ncbi:MAG: DUF433 domain-containing protein [Thermomicrobiales bacterium]
MSNHTERIIQDPAILGGRPAVKGTLIPVVVVLDDLAHNPRFDELLADYPRLTMDDVKACFAYAEAGHPLSPIDGACVGIAGRL